MFTLLGFSDDLTGVAMFPAVLKTRSDAVLVAQIHMYLRANFAKSG